MSRKGDKLIGHADDSGSSDKVVYILSGWIATVEDWDQFSDEWEAICVQPPKTPRFHMKTARRKNGRRVRDLAALVCKKTKYRVEAAMSRQNYDKFAKGTVGPQIDNPYFFLFYTVILATVQLMEKLGLEGSVDWIFDEQGKIGVEAVAWYEFIKERATPELKRRLGSTPIFRDDDKVLPLKAADMLAWQGRRYVVEDGPEGIPHNDIYDSFLAKHGVSCNITGPNLVEIVDELTSGRSILFKAECLYFLPIPKGETK